MRNKFKWCVSTCKKICPTVKTASGITRFIEDKGYGKWFNLLYPLVKTRDSCKPENACEPSALGRNADCIDYGISQADDEGEGSSTSSNFTDKSSDPPYKKVAPVKKATFQKSKTDQVDKALELLQATIDNDPAKELLQILKEDMKASREQEMRYFQMMCGLMNPTINPNPQAHGNPYHYRSPTLQPLIYGSTSSKEDHYQLLGFQALNLSMQQNSVFRPYSASSHSRTPSSRSPLTVSADSADQSLPKYVQASVASQQQGFVPQYEELRPVTPTYVYEDSTF